MIEFLKELIGHPFLFIAFCTTVVAVALIASGLILALISLALDRDFAGFSDRITTKNRERHLVQSDDVTQVYIYDEKREGQY